MLKLGTRTIGALTAAIFFILFFGSGAAAPLDALPNIIQKILDWNPLKIWFDALVAAYTGTDYPAGIGWKIGFTLVLGLLLGIIGLNNWRKTE